MEQNLNGKKFVKPQIKIDAQEVNLYNNMYSKRGKMLKEKSVKNEKLEAFKRRLDAFKSVSTLKEAKQILDSTMPVQLEKTTFFIGDAKCIIINKSNLVKICLQSPSEIIVYNFT